jgi:hypothetical protein
MKLPETLTGLEKARKESGCHADQQKSERQYNLQDPNKLLFALNDPDDVPG